MGVEEIKMHPWFADINWKKLELREVTPPFKPNVRNSNDVGNIDEEFL